MRRPLLLILCILLPALLPATTAAAAERPSLAGRMLVAAPKLADPFFRHSVVYLVEHDAHGAVGVIVNRRMGEGSLAELVAELGFSIPEDREVGLYFGGPVALKGVFVLHSAEYNGPRTMRAPGGLAMTGDKGIIRAIINGNAPKRMRFMMGYAGWGAGQLEDEIARGDWLDAPADDGLIFQDTTEPEEIWRQARDKAGLTL